MASQQLPQIESEPRSNLGSRAAKRLRKDGRLPAVVYGHKLDPLHVSIDAKWFSDVLRQDAHLVELATQSKTEPCLIKDIQWSYLGDQIIHVDLARVDLSEQVEVEVAVELIGEPKALEETGAILDHRLNSVQIRCRADQIPERIRHDIEQLKVGESVTVVDLQLPPGITAMHEPDTMVAQITVMQQGPEEAGEALEPAAANEEPEVIGKGGKEEEQAGSEGEAKQE